MKETRLYEITTEGTKEEVRQTWHFLNSIVGIKFKRRRFSREKLEKAISLAFSQLLMEEDIDELGFSKSETISLSLWNRLRHGSIWK